MKKLFLLIGIFLLASLPALSQKAVRKSSVKRAATVKKAVSAKPSASVPVSCPPLERDKFDPKRDPNADLQAAVVRAQKEKKRIILDVGGEWCGWCRLMDYYFLENKALLKMRDENFIWVKINMSEENENKEFLSKYPAIIGYPHLFVLETDGSLLHSQETSELEEQPDTTNKDQTKKPSKASYNLFKFVEFLKKWSS